MDVEKITNYLCDSTNISSDDAQKIENKRGTNSEFDLSCDEMEAAMVIADAVVYDKCADAQKSVWSRLEKTIENKKKGYFISRNMLYRYVAAAVVVFAMFGVGISFLFNRSSDPSMMRLELSGSGTTTTHLFDGSIVTLNSNSSLEYSSEFNSVNRDIFLSGEAWFDVKKSKTPFVVYSNNISVTALGTSFNVREHGGSTVVTLRSGKVVLANATTNDSLTTLLPGQKAIIDIDMNVDIEECDALCEGIWREDSLEFNGKSLDEIVKTLEKWHGITIINNIMPNGKTYWMKMTDKRIVTTLEVFKRLEDIDYHINGDTVVLNKK